MKPDTAGPGGQAFDQLDERLDDVFEVLAHAYRRFVLVYLASEGREADPRSIAVSLARYDEETTVDRAHLSLRHAHLPKLEAARFVEWDGVVRLREEAERALEILGVA